MTPVGLRGFTLVEVLVSMVILSLGMLGAAALLSGSLRLNAEARYRSDAARLATNLASILRMNRDNVDAFVTLGTADALGGMLDDDCLETDGDDTTLVKTPTHQLTCWAQKINDAMPSAFATISFTSSTSVAYVDVTIAWLDREVGDFGDLTGRRLASTKDECESLNQGGKISRLWSGSMADKDAEACLIQQRWSLRP